MLTPTTPDERKQYAEMVQHLAGYAGDMVKYPVSEMMGLIGDTVSIWRLRNRVRMLATTREYLRAKGVIPEKVMPDVFVPLLEAAGDTEDPKLSDMFAQLMAAHLDPKTHGNVHPSFAKVLAQLSPFDARFLDKLDQRERQDSRIYWHEIYPIFPDNSDSDIALSTENLSRLGLVTASMEHVWVTTYGCLFIAVCTGREMRETKAVSPIKNLMHKIDAHERTLEDLKKSAGDNDVMSGL